MSDYLNINKLEIYYSYLLLKLKILYKKAKRLSKYFKILKLKKAI